MVSRGGNEAMVGPPRTSEHPCVVPFLMHAAWYAPVEVLVFVASGTTVLWSLNMSPREYVTHIYM